MVYARTSYNTRLAQKCLFDIFALIWQNIEGKLGTMPSVIWAYLNLAKQGVQGFCMPFVARGTNGEKCHFIAVQHGVNAAMRLQDVMYNAG